MKTTVNNLCFLALAGLLMVGALFVAGCASSTPNKSSLIQPAQPKESPADIAFQMAETTNTIASYETFLAAFPDSKWKEEAAKRVREKKEADDRIRAKIETWDVKTALDYLAQNSEGKFLQEVLATIGRRKLATIASSNSLVLFAVTMEETNAVAVTREELRGVPGDPWATVPVKETIRPKSGHTFLTVACHITQFGDRKPLVVREQDIFMVQRRTNFVQPSTNCKTFSCKMVAAGPKSKTEKSSMVDARVENGILIFGPAKMSFEIDRTATIHITAEVPAENRDTLTVSLNGQSVPVASPPGKN